MLPREERIIIMCNNCSETSSIAASQLTGGKLPEIACPRCGDGRMAPPTIAEDPVYFRRISSDN